MSKNNLEIMMVPLQSIVPDELQPRRDFDVNKLARLAASIKRFGIKQPLVVEKYSGGKYLLQDGERRFRAAQELKLDKVPVLVKEPETATERLISQFHVQELHEGWTGVEKAVAVTRLADALEMPVMQLADLLSLPKTSIQDYIAFGNLLNRREFEKSEISITFARHIEFTKATIRNGYKKIGEEMPKNLLKDAEKMMLDRIRSGEITNRQDMIKLRTTLTLDPTLVVKLINSNKLTIRDSYDKFGGRAKSLKQNISYQSTTLGSYVATVNKEGLYKHFKEDDRTKKNLIFLQKGLTQLINNI